jgi:hypothetical protein
MATALDVKTSVRWEAANASWLEERAVELQRSTGGRVGVGTVVQAVVTRARLEWEAAQGELGGAPAAQESRAGGPGGAGVSDGARTVRDGAAPVPPSGAAPRVVRLDVVVARALAPGAGRITPVDRARALRAIKDGRVRVDGHDGPLEAGMHVSPGAVVVS